MATKVGPPELPTRIAQNCAHPSGPDITEHVLSKCAPYASSIVCVGFELAASTMSRSPAIATVAAAACPFFTPGFDPASETSSLTKTRPLRGPAPHLTSTHHLIVPSW
jgi:hypothetical protein